MKTPFDLFLSRSPSRDFKVVMLLIDQSDCTNKLSDCVRIICQSRLAESSPGATVSQWPARICLGEAAINHQKQIHKVQPRVSSYTHQRTHTNVSWKSHRVQQYKQDSHSQRPNNMFLPECVYHYSKIILHRNKRLLLSISGQKLEGKYANTPAHSELCSC